MSDDSCPVKLQGRSRPLFRRQHTKADGRSVSLYGFKPHMGQAGVELVRTAGHHSELRRDPLRGTWAIYSPHRQTRTFLPSAAADPLAPFRDGAAPTEIAFADFELAVFDNQFSSLQPDTGPTAHSQWASGPATGHCEVVVYSSQPEGSLYSVGQDRRILLLEALIDRYETLFQKGAAYVLPFENRGEQVGVTLAHPHGQIYAFPFVPAPQAAAAKAFEDGYDLVSDHATWDGHFNVATDGGLTAFCPPFGRFPYETWIMPKRPCRGPWDLNASEIEELARLLGDIPRRLDALFGAPMPYMMSFQASPREAGPDFQFTVQFYPIMRDAGRLKYLAGVEQFTSVFTVDIVPETAAERLRGL
ncbi:galactose-1-phosphate uridylyltransferase [Hyphomonas sp.]|uniref:galactose-1-phosphate uridylyltransferase n=1 Tax=Hyphomonas sp. TaxID=87 RepID=UPI0032EDD576